MTENPYRRLRELTKTSQKDFAAKYGFAKTTMTYVESGQYPDLSEDMILALGQECHEKAVSAKQVLHDEYNAEDLQTAYHSWQSVERMQAASRFRVAPRRSMDSSPFSLLILDITGTTQSFCKTLKVPAATVLRYATGKTRSMPRAIEDALKEVQYPYLGELREEQERWSARA